MRKILAAGVALGEDTGTVAIGAKLAALRGDDLPTSRAAAMQYLSDAYEGSRLVRRGGHTRKGFYESREWLTLRYFTLKRFGRKCMLCHTLDGEMHVDHIRPRSKFPALELDPENLQVLCKACNLGKSNLDDEDFR